jgi:hypothetical protein
VKPWSEQPLVWRRTGGGEVPYATESGGCSLRLRVNDFPAERLYTLLVDGVEAEHLDAWPQAWRRPPADD